jgi:hypothetical protein
MIGDKRPTEAADSPRTRPGGVVGERDQRGEAEGKPTVERWPVRMQTRVAINRVRIPVAVNPRVPGPGSSSQG